MDTKQDYFCPYCGKKMKQDVSDCTGTTTLICDSCKYMVFGKDAKTAFAMINKETANEPTP